MDEDRRAKRNASIWIAGTTGVANLVAYWILMYQSSGRLATFVHGLPPILVLTTIPIVSVSLGIVVFRGIKDSPVLVGEDAKVRDPRGGIWTLWKRHSWIVHFLLAIWAARLLDEHPWLAAVVFFGNLAWMFIYIFRDDRRMKQEKAEGAFTQPPDKD